MIHSLIKNVMLYINLSHNLRMANGAIVHAIKPFHQVIHFVVLERNLILPPKTVLCLIFVMLHKYSW